MEPMLPVVPGFKLEVTEYAKDQEQYRTLPCHKRPDGTITIRWGLSWKERFLIFINGCFWHEVMTFNRPLQPMNLQTTCPIMGHTGYDEEC